MAESRSGRGRRVFAAGAVVWQATTGQDCRVAVVHRPRYDDWSLPKGKLDAGESEPVAAVREVAEETGYRVTLGRRLGEARYRVDGRPKSVCYFSARVTGGEWEVNEEVDRLLWLTVDDAAAKVSYPHDRTVLRRFAELPAATDTTLVVRHARAGDKKRFRGDDRLRPLDKVGRAQAEALAGMLLAFGARTLSAADRTRCRQTLEPLAQELGVSIATEPTLTAEAYAADRAAGRHRLLELQLDGGQGGAPALCTQGEVIPDLVAWRCARDEVSVEVGRPRKGSVWALSSVGGTLVAADHYPSALPPEA